MKRLVILYGHPEDPDAFDKHYRERHVPLVHATPNVAAFAYSDGPIEGGDDHALYHMVATLDFASDADLAAAMGSEEGQAATADLANFASGGATVLTMDIVT